MNTEAYILGIRIEMEALVSFREGMIAENKIYELKKLPPFFDVLAFGKVSDRLRLLGLKLLELAPK